VAGYGLGGYGGCNTAYVPYGLELVSRDQLLIKAKAHRRGRHALNFPEVEMRAAPLRTARSF
jgi:hypothetical protein